MSKYKIKVKIIKQNKKAKKLKEQIRLLMRNTDDMSYELNSAHEDLKHAEEEIRYMSGFISWKNLDDEYAAFRRDAHEVTDENMPFPRLVI